MKREDLSQFVGEVGVELGVQNGTFSRVLLKRSDCLKFYSIDRWAGDRGHDETEYATTIANLKEFGGRSSVIRASFSNALSMFEEEYFDFIYIDGYAHMGQEGGETINSWWEKLKPKGCFSGHDYSEKYFPLTYKYVNKFVKNYSLQLHVTQEVGYPSWYVFKP